jgi:hypothetical protein
LEARHHESSGVGESGNEVLNRNVLKPIVRIRGRETTGFNKYINV